MRVTAREREREREGACERQRARESERARERDLVYEVGAVELGLRVLLQLKPDPRKVDAYGKVDGRIEKLTGRIVVVLKLKMPLSQFKNKYLAKMQSGSEEGSYSRLRDSCIT